MCPELVPVAGGPIAGYGYYPYQDDLPSGGALACAWPKGLETEE